MFFVGDFLFLLNNALVVRQCCTVPSNLTVLILQGHKSICAENGVEAVQACLEEHFDLILMV